MISLNCNILYCWSIAFFVSNCILVYCIVLYCFVLYCIVLYCIVLYCIVLYCIVLYFVVFCCIICIIFHCIILNYIVLHCIQFRCSLQLLVLSAFEIHRNIPSCHPARHPKKARSNPLDALHREIAILKKVDHPNVVKLVEVLFIFFTLS